MRSLFVRGDKKVYNRIVEPNDFAQFNGQVIHPVFSTFALARDAEWTTRQFILDLCEVTEEGIGTFINIEHISPAFEGEEITFNGYIEEIKNNEVICEVNAYVGTRLIARGRTGQKILKREKLRELFKRA